MHFHLDGREKIGLFELGREVDGPSSQLPTYLVVTRSSGVTMVTSSSGVTIVTSSSEVTMVTSSSEVTMVTSSSDLTIRFVKRILIRKSMNNLSPTVTYLLYPSIFRVNL